MLLAADDSEGAADRRRLILLAIVFAVLVAAFLLSVAGAAGHAGAVLAALGRLRALGWRGAVAFFAIQMIVAVIGFVPASLLGLAAGALYGVALGFGLAAAGLMAGAAAAFALARSALRPLIERRFARSERLGRFDAALARDGWRLVFLLRASPAMPFSLTSYALGLSGVGLRDYMVGTLASLLALLGYVVLGSLGAAGMAAAESGARPVRLALMILGAAATLLLLYRMGRLFRGVMAAEAAQNAGKRSR